MRFVRLLSLRLAFLAAGLAFTLSAPAQSVAPSHYVRFANVDALKEYLHWKPGRPLISAHRGGPTAGYPENCPETFEHTLQFTPALIECDVQLSKDDSLVMMHDETLDRTSNGTGKLSDHTFAELRELRLEDTEGKPTPYRIPTLTEVLNWARGRAIITLDIKKGLPAARVARALRQARAESFVVIITYSAAQALEYHQLLPDMMISATVRNEEELKRLEETGIPMRQILAFVGITEPTPALYQQLHDRGVSCILGTMGNLDRSAAARNTNVYAQLVQRGADVLATDQPKEAAAALKELSRAGSHSPSGK